MRGTASEVLGMVWDTVFRKTVRDRRTVTSEEVNLRFLEEGNI